ncbi:ribosomal protein S18 acetylase RimI-like enzyme [Kineococcus xinjiangensis]|uniref:Ribosomal protein S18 acetylase RimI-like enzyme n=1 Tax=Kineococcus xinjiangensis TaxID=512762 RepID=A0A2S6IM96_9ACTN|nr:GNAT family N-acetyltransferase [Kineococcus xinjiangensis]PPK95301.1 ribosomal protein S18 acetylase RimI-like enzyme [Kineococcus xinjiangensis]
MTIPEAAVRLRRATAADAAVVAALNEPVQHLHRDAAPGRFAPHDPAAVAGFFATQVAGDGLVWIADLAGRPAGYLYAVEVHRAAGPFTADEHVLFVHHLGVDPAARRRGVGSALLAAAEDHARAHRLSGLRLDSWLFNDGAHAFFRGLGFEPVRTRFARDL